MVKIDKKLNKEEREEVDGLFSFLEQKHKEDLEMLSRATNPDLRKFIEGKIKHDKQYLENLEISIED